MSNDLVGAQVLFCQLPGGVGSVEILSFDKNMIADFEWGGGGVVLVCILLVALLGVLDVLLQFLMEFVKAGHKLLCSN